MKEGNNHPSLITTNHRKQGSGPSFTSTNPATGEILWQGFAASSSEVNDAVHQAAQSFEAWSNLPIDERSRFLSDYADALRDSQKFLVEIISQETGKPLWDSAGEVSAMIQKIGLSLEAYGRRCAGIIRDLPQGRSITRHRPHGVIAVLGPYNFPGHLPNSHIIPALLAGNTIVFKPSELTPRVAEEVFRCWEKVNLPSGVLNLIQGGRETGKALIEHPAIQGLCFTGSYPTGRYLSEFFGKDPSKILALELGGNNPLVIGSIDDIQTAVYLTIRSAFLTSGQRCTCARRLIVPQTPEGDAFLVKLIAETTKISVGPYTQHPEPFMGPVISTQHAQHLLDKQNELKAMGGQTLVEMHALQPGVPFLSPGLMDVTPIAHRPDEEIFGPFLQVIRVKSFEEAIQEANNTKFGLAAGLFSQSIDEYHAFYNHVQAGIINWNTQLTGASSAAPFGGIKWSGNHRPSAFYAADYCSYPVASFESPELQMPA